MLMHDHNLSPEMRTAIAKGRELLGDDAHPVALLIGGTPVSLYADVMAGISTAVEEAGFNSVLIATTGAGVVWAVPQPRRRDA